MWLRWRDRRVGRAELAPCARSTFLFVAVTVCKLHGWHRYLIACLQPHRRPYTLMCTRHSHTRTHVGTRSRACQGRGGAQAWAQGRFLRPSADARAHTRRRVLTDTDRDFTCKTAVFSLHVIVNEKTYSCRFVLLRRSRGRTGVAVERAMRLSKRAPLCGVKLTRRSRIPRLSKLGLRVRACGRVLVVQSCSSCAFTG